MATTQTPKPSPLDAERARLREKGFSDSTIEQHLISRESGSSWPQAQATGVGVGVGGQSVLGGVLANLGALMTHANNALPKLLLDCKQTFAPDTAPRERGKALGSLLVKLAIIGVIGYAVKQEYNQHIISATGIAAADNAVKQQAAKGATTPIDRKAVNDAALKEMFPSSPASKE